MKSVWIVLAAAVALHANDPKIEESFWEIYTQALRGNPKAQFNAGVIFERGLGTEKNESKALEWYTKSAEQGNMDAQYNLGLMYLSGRGTVVDEEIGKKWLEAAVKQGDKEAAALLERLRLKRQSVLKKEDKYGESEPIVPMTLVLNHTALICDKPSRQSECRSYPEGLAITSKMKKGVYFKISGMGSPKGWQPYTEEGWIHETDVTRRDKTLRKMEQKDTAYHDITPITLIVNKRAKVCEVPYDAEPCSFYQSGSVVTSKMMSGDYYKISGIASPKGWQPLGLPRWIHSTDVEKR